MRFKSSAITLAASAMLAVACAAPVVTPAPTLPARPAQPPSTPTTIVRVVEVGAVPVPPSTPVPPAPTPRPPTPLPAPPAASPASGGSQPVATAPTPAGPRPVADGTFVVGTDLQPGTYRAPGGQTCYWARLTGFGGSVSDVITNGAGSISPLVTIAPSDKGFESRNCGAWTKVG